MSTKVNPILENGLLQKILALRENETLRLEDGVYARKGEALYIRIYDRDVVTMQRPVLNHGVYQAGYTYADPGHLTWGNPKFQHVLDTYTNIQYRVVGGWVEFQRTFGKSFKALELHDTTRVSFVPNGLYA